MSVAVLFAPFGSVTPPGTATGLQFSPVTREALEAALHRAADLWSDRAAWQSLQSNAMQSDVSWAEPAGEFARLYTELTASKN